MGPDAVSHESGGPAWRSILSFIPGTVSFVQRNLERFDIHFLTNNTSKNLNDYVTKLRGMGIDMTLARMLSPLIPLADRIETE